VADFFSKPPADPWPPPSRPRLLLGGPGSESPRSCMNLFGSGVGEAVARYAGPVETTDWQEEVMESEDDVMVSVVAFLVNQTMVYAKTQQLHGLGSEYTPVYQEEIFFWFDVLGILFALSFGVFLLRAQLSDKSWGGTILQQVLLSSMGFSIYRTSNWQMRLVLGEDYPLEKIISAVVFSAVSISVVILLDRTANIVALVAPECSAKLHGRFQGTRTMTPFEWAMATVIKILGLLVGASWSRAFGSAFQDIIESQPLLAEREVLSKVVISCVLISLMLIPWRRSILPMAEMSEKMHQDAINFEQHHLDAGESFQI